MDENTTSNAPISWGMDTQTLAGMAHTLQTVAIAALIFVACAYIPKLKQRAQLAKLPVFEGSTGGEKHRQGYLKSAKDLYNEGYQKVREHWLLAHPHLTSAVQRQCLFDDHLRWYVS
jgi:predicted transposase YbfD/YdcC